MDVRYERLMASDINLRVKRELLRRGLLLPATEGLAQTVGSETSGCQGLKCLFPSLLFLLNNSRFAMPRPLASFCSAADLLPALSC